jgi:pimeloyl-ACP methyl ester carboxylesterase
MGCLSRSSVLKLYGRYIAVDRILVNCLQCRRHQEDVVERGYLATRLGQVHYYAAGEGELVLLIHQSGRSARMFAELVPVLGASCRAVAIDLPGFGNSDPLPEGTTIDELADVCADAINALGVSRAHVYGHHSGNKVATALAVRHPALVDRLVLAGQSHSIIADQAERNVAIHKFVKPYEDVAAARDPALMRAEKWALTYRTMMNVWLQPGAMSGSHKGGDALAKALVLDTLQGSEGSSRLYSANLKYDLGAGYAAIPVKTLVLEIVTPEEDRLIGRQGASLLKIIPGSTLAEIEHEDGDGVTLEGRADDLSAILVDFFALTS